MRRENAFTVLGSAVLAALHVSLNRGPARNPARRIDVNCSRCGFDEGAHGVISNVCPDHRGFFNSRPPGSAPAAAAPGVLADPPAAPGSPAEPAEPLFVAVKSAVMAGKDHIATACSKTMAKRIAAALNKARKEKDGSV
jgi:hypothetical protein